MLVEARNLSKAYPLSSTPAQRAGALWKILTGQGHIQRKPVLQDISLQVEPGQSVGIIGRNGAGKSTLLKLITGVLNPSGGTVRCNGSVGALLELGAGFQPELTGRQNIVMSAALYGADVDFIAEQQEQIIEFAGIGAYIDEPVRHYSSGMVVRLGFAIISVLKPDLLVTDEVLAVGDIAFQRQCTRWMDRYVSEGGTLLLVSHSAYHIQKLCSHALWLHEGTIRQEGDPAVVTQAYQAWVEAERRAQIEAKSDTSGDHCRIVEHQLIGYQKSQGIEVGQDLVVTGSIYSPDGREPVVAVGIVRADGTPVYGTTNQAEGGQLHALGKNRWRFKVKYPNLPLLPGTYESTMLAMDPEGLQVWDSSASSFVIRGQLRQLGLCRLRMEWD